MMKLVGLLAIGMAISAAPSPKPVGHKVRASSETTQKNVYRILISPPILVTTKDCLEVVVDQEVVLDRVGKKLWFRVGTPEETACTITRIAAAKK
jgi:hypothetical protein